MLTTAGSVAGTAPTPAEMATARAWVAAAFDGRVESAAPAPGLVVLSNNGPVQRNARGGEPLRIGARTYAHGLYCHAPSKVIVRLPEPGKRLRAEVGVDARAGGGSIEFTVRVGAAEGYRSGVMHATDAARVVNVDLGGAGEFVLAVGDAGDGISCDQANWAEAEVVTVSGHTLRLGDLPIVTTRAPLEPGLPFSLNVGGRAFRDAAPAWRATHSERRLDDARVERTYAWDDPETALQVRCTAVVYRDFPTVEWTLHVRNAGSADSPLVEAVRALDTRFTRGVDGEFALRHHTGTLVAACDFEPHRTVLEPGHPLRFAPPGGRPMGAVFPYFNLEQPGEGVIVVVGWPGQWDAAFAADDRLGVHVTAGQETTRFRLHPGEEVRTPLIVLQFWQGDAVRAQNIWRRWMFAHNLPRPGGRPIAPQMPAVSGNQFPGLLCNEADECRYLDRYAEEGIKLDYWWMDAGWYVNRGDWTSTGTWEVDRKRFPRGLRHVTDHARKQGVHSIVWFEPERVTPGSWLAEQHPDWVLGGIAGGLLDLGNPAAWRWCVERIDRILVDEGIDAYRQDFNMDPLPFWRAHDAPDRQGITENHHVTGYLAFWDELLKRHPGMLIDSCASGGHRNDLETLRRSVPLLRSDHIFDSVGEQGHTYGLASWIPYYGTGFIDFDTYIFRSAMCPNTTLSCDARRRDIDWALLRRLIAQWRAVAPSWWGDFYPLTRYSLDTDMWVAWQFDRPETGEGMVQAFRRERCVFETARFPLHGLDRAATYLVRDLDAPRARRFSGAELADRGVPVAIGARPGAVVITYRRAGRKPAP